MPTKLSHNTLIDRLVTDVSRLTFRPPVTHVYNPLAYARDGYDQYTAKFGTGPKEVLFVGMNPGPWGMTQTGIPFGEIEAVTQWMEIRARVTVPEDLHPKRPVEGIRCRRREISGKRLWGWARQRFGTPDAFFSKFFVANYCPLMFVESSGRNRTPDKLPAAERQPLFEACDKALRDVVDLLKPSFVVGIGGFSAKRIPLALAGKPLTIGRITHPSPANPRANKGWEPLIEAELEALGIRLENNG